MTFNSITKSTTKGIQITIRDSGSQGNQTILKDKKSGKQLVFDAGIMPSPAMKRSMKNIIGVCITHCHRDHCGKVRHYKIPIFGTEEELTDGRVTSQYDMVFNVPDVTYIQPNEKFSIGPFTITALKANHDTPNPVHYYVKIRDFGFFYGCDSVDYPDEYDKYFKDADVIMIECNYDIDMMKNDSGVEDPYPEDLKIRITEKGHASSDYIKKRMKKYENKLILSHLSRAYNLPSKMDETFKKSIVVASRDRCPIYIHL